MTDLPTLLLSPYPCSQAVPSEHDPLAELWCDPQGEVQALGHRVGDEYWFHVLGLASYHLNAPEGVTAYPVAEANENEVTERYYRTALPLALQLQGKGVLHASSVRGRTGVIGFCADSMTGKSTLAFGLAQQGYPVWGDDVLAFSTSPTGVTALPLPFRLRLRPTSARHYRLPGADASPRWEGLPQKGVHSSPLAALCILERVEEEDVLDGQAAQLERLPGTEAYRLLPNYAFVFDLEPEPLRRQLAQAYLDLVAHAPVFRLRFRAGLDYLPDVVAAAAQLAPSLEPAREPSYDTD